MTSKERLLKVLNGEVPDKVPVSTYELCGYNSEAFENKEPSYNNLMDYIRKHTDALTMWCEGSDHVLGMSASKIQIEEEKYDEDEYHVTKNYITIGDKTLTSTSKYSDDVVTTWQVEHMCKDLDDMEAILSVPFTPLTFDMSDYKRASDELGDNGLMFGQIGDPICTMMSYLEFGEGTVCALTQPERFKECLDELHRRNMINIENSLKQIAMPIYRIYGPEYATPPYLRPEHFKEFVYPYLCEMIDLYHKYDAKVRVHSHGNIGQVLDMMIDTGMDAIDPCEAPPDGDITLAEVKKRVMGERSNKRPITIFGNLQLKVLEHSSEKEVKQAVIQCMNEAKYGGGYVIMPTASPINLPLSKKTEENYKVFIDTANEYGVYYSQ